MDKERYEQGQKLRREVLMQTAIYCGVPAALDSFRTAQEVFREQDTAR